MTGDMPATTMSSNKTTSHSTITSLKKLKKKYSLGQNIIDHLNEKNSSKINSLESILISYDLQAGSYIKESKSVKFKKIYNDYSSGIAKIIDEITGNKINSLLEVGVGECTTLSQIISKIKHIPKLSYGFDISWSRIRFGIDYMKLNNYSQPHFLFMANLYQTPIASNSIDIVYTSHSLEPNGSREKEALVELYRITRNYLVLFEPSYEFADEGAKKRMRKLRFVKNLYKTAIDLGYDIIENKLFDHPLNPENPTGLMIIKKKIKRKSSKNTLVCPITRAPLKFARNSYYSNKSLLAYPIVDQVPCLMSQYSVIATHYLNKTFKK